jgi:molybdopterin-binding protein
MAQSSPPFTHQQPLFFYTVTEGSHETQCTQSAQGKDWKGATTVRIDVGGGLIITSSITNEAVADLDLHVKDEAWAVIKASNVMIDK